VGRIWRVYSTLSNVNSMGRMGRSATKSRLEIYFVKVLNFMAGSWSSKNTSFRKVVTVKQTCTLIFMLIFPQVVLQVVASVVIAGDVVTEYSTSGDVGREVCDSKDEWVMMTGTIYITFLSLLAVLMAWFSRDLPSAFNEKDQIFNVATISAIITGIALGLGEVIDEPTTTPDAEVRLALSSTRLGSDLIWCYLLLLLLLSAHPLCLSLDWNLGESFAAYHLAKGQPGAKWGDMCCQQNVGRQILYHSVSRFKWSGHKKCSCFRPP
jgi:hypothetical protein